MAITSAFQDDDAGSIPADPLQTCWSGSNSKVVAYRYRAQNVIAFDYLLIVGFFVLR
ncbi:TPA: hypothetical protein G8V68_004927 [Salmonella enterica]|nr:hypothetical protein [Salmonella enterica]